jgi:hypothetical protein
MPERGVNMLMSCKPEHCIAVCDKVTRMLKEAGCKIDNKNCHADVLAILDNCILPAAVQAHLEIGLRSILVNLALAEKQGFESGYLVLAKEAADAALARLSQLPPAEVQVVIGVEDGVVQDQFAYTDGKMADAKQADLDKKYGVKRDAEGYVTNEPSHSRMVTTYVLPLNKDE